MIRKLLKDIDEYVFFLRKKGLQITIHGELEEFMYSLSKFNRHYNPYCTLVKSNDMAWQRCICSQKKIYSRICPDAFWGMCHAGVEEYVFPIPGNHSFISVSGYGVNEQEAMRRINRLTDDFIIDKAELIKIYKAKLIHHKPDPKIGVLINPLCHMLMLLKLLKPSDFTMPDTSGDLYNKILVYTQRNFMKNITLEDIAKYCSCSVSTVCHIFKSRNGKSIHQYITGLRMEQAENLLSNCDLPISFISELTGFGDPDYFATVFKKYHGISPTQYKENII